MNVESDISQADVRRVSPEELRCLAASLRSSRQRILCERSLGDLLKQLEHAVELWFGPDSTFRRRAENVLPAATGFSPQMIRHGLPLMIEPLRAGAIGRLLDAELGDRRKVTRSHRTALILHVLSANLPALAAVPVALSLAVRSAVMTKASRTDAGFSSLFIESIKAVDAELGSCAAAVYWPGGDREAESVAFSVPDLVVASGNDATIADIARRVPGRFIGHGHRISFAAISREALDDWSSVAARLAYDVTLWDQQGCLSPQLAYVERGGALSVEGFAEEVGRQLDQLDKQLPPRTLSLGEQIAIRRFRQEAEWRAVRGEEISLFASPRGLSWTVAYDGSVAFSPTPLNRTVWIKPVDSLADLLAVLSPVRDYLEAVGIAADRTRRAELATLFSHAGVHHVCPLGEMQHADLTWRQGGNPRVAEWLEREPR